MNNQESKDISKNQKNDCEIKSATNSNVRMSVLWVGAQDIQKV